VQNRKAIGSVRGRLLRLLGFDVVGQGGFNGSNDAECVDRFDEVAISTSFVGEKHIHVSIKQEENWTFVEVTHLFAVAHSQAGGYTTHVADLQVEQHEPRVNLTDGGDDVDAGPHPMKHVGTGNRRLDLVG
jgi:hypothetical protein